MLKRIEATPAASFGMIIVTASGLMRRAPRLNMTFNWVSKDSIPPRPDPTITPGPVCISLVGYEFQSCVVHRLLGSTDEELCGTIEAPRLALDDHGLRIPPPDLPGKSRRPRWRNRTG